MEIRRDVFQAIADPTRRAILSLVAIQAMTPGAIAENFESSRQTISKHIQILSECELLSQTQAGREIYYHLNPEKMKYKGFELIALSFSSSSKKKSSEQCGQVTFFL